MVVTGSVVVAVCSDVLLSMEVVVVETTAVVSFVVEVSGAIVVSIVLVGGAVVISAVVDRLSDSVVVASAGGHSTTCI